MFKNNEQKDNHKRYYYQIPMNVAILATSIFFTTMVERYEHNIGGGIGRPLLFLLINVEIFIAIFLAASIIRQSVILFLERRKERPGSVFKKNLLFSFIFLSILPGIFIFLGPSKLVVKHLDLWFGARVEQGLAGGLTLYQETSREMRHRLALAGASIADSMTIPGATPLPIQIENFEVHWWPLEEEDINLKAETAQWRVFREFNDRGIKELKASFTNQLKTLTPDSSTIIDFFGSTYWVKHYPTGILALIFRPPAGVRSALIKIQNAHTDYMHVREMKHVLKFNFYLQAIILLFLVLVLAIWCAFYLARGISQPIQNLLEATNDVRAGKLKIQVEPTGSRDLQALSVSFNEMTKSLAAAQTDIDRKNNELISNTVKLNTLKTWQEAVKQIAHEIKNPLTPIQLTTQRLQRRCLPTLHGDEAKIFDESCSLILDQVSTIKRLVADFSSFAAPAKLDLQPCNIATLIQSVVALFQLSYPDIEFVILRDGPEGLLRMIGTKQDNPTIMIDIDKMKRVFVNLITNSIEAFKNAQTPKPTITITITSLLVIPTSEPGSNPTLTHTKQLHITFQDNGPGIAPTVADKLFLPYISTGKKNMGLGLAIVHEIITQHGGTICAQPAQQGAKFAFDITIQ